jgi:hypothetical protein
VFTTDDGRVTIHASVRDSVRPPVLRARTRAAVSWAHPICGHGTGRFLSAAGYCVRADISTGTGMHKWTLPRAAGQPTHCGVTTHFRSTRILVWANAYALQRHSSALAQVNIESRTVPLYGPVPVGA